MTVVADTSALTAVIFGEPEASVFASVLASHANSIAVSAATLIECEIVLGARHGPNAVQDLSLLLTKIGADVVAFDQEQAALAGTAWRRFGKGHHPAALNLGDCYSYALAKHLGAPLLFKGDDFRQTDIVSALN